MKIFNLSRRSGKTTMLIHTSYITGVRIITIDQKRAEIIKDQAIKMGLDIPEPMSVNNFKCIGSFEPAVLIDEVVDLLASALRDYVHADVIACTCTIPILDHSVKEEKDEQNKDI